MLAIRLAAGDGGATTDPQGAFNVLARHGWTKALLILVCVGLPAYSGWRFAQALFDRGDMGNDFGGLFRRGIQLVQGLAYAALTVGAVRTLVATNPRPGGAGRSATGMLGWPAGRELVGVIGGILFISAVVTGYWALSRRFTESLATEEMGERTKRLGTVLGIIGLLALAVVLAIIGWFLLKAAIEFDPRDPVGIGGALSEVAQTTYGTWLLGATASGLVVFAVFDLFQARYHRA